MDYDAVLEQAIMLLQREQRLSYRVLKRRLQLDDETLEDLKEDLIYAKQLAVDEEGKVLVWASDARAGETLAASTRVPARPPRSYTPPYLAEKILHSRSALEGERKQVTVLFADLKGSTELIRDLYVMQYFFQVGQYDQAIASSQRALALAAASGDTRTPIQANTFLGMVYYFQGDYRQAMDACRRAMALLEGEWRYERFGNPILPAVTSRAYLSLCLAQVGAFAEGIAVGEAGLRIAEAVNHPASLVSAYRCVGLPYLRQGNLYQALPVLERAMSLCEEVDLPFQFSLVALALGSAYVLCGRVDEAVQLLERALEQATSTSTMPIRMLQLSILGEAHLRAGRLEEAHMLAARALKYFRTHLERGNEVYALRLLGDIATHRDPPEVEEADASYRQALALAEELGLRPLKAHCHLGLGTLYAKTGRREQARTELSAAITLYRTMDMTFWLPQAEAALAQVEGRT